MLQAADGETPATVVPATVVQARRHAHASGLLYVSDTEPGIRRRRRGARFHYLGPNGRPVTAERTLDRIRRLAIPPAYTDVWICREPRGHLQATGRDARQRKQYRYHTEWRETRDSGKFARMIEFGAQLPRLRRRLKQDLALAGLPKNKVLAAIVKLLDETLLRVGNEEYARTNKSYGLTTLRDRHVTFLRDGRAFFSFRGKSGRTQELVLDDRRLARIIRHCQQLPGQQLFQYVDDEGKRQPVDSGMVNDYLREAMGEQRRRLHRQGFPHLGRQRSARSPSSRVSPSGERVTGRAFNHCVASTAKHVAEALGNTPAVCRKSYINPVVFEAWRDRAVERLVPRGPLAPSRLEKVALALLRERERQSKARKGNGKA